VVGISFRSRDQLKPDFVWGVLGKVVQPNARFGLGVRLGVHLDHVRMPVGNDREKTKGRSLDILSAIKKYIVKVKAGFLCLPIALIIAMDKVKVDPKYKSYRDCYNFKQPVQDLLSASGVKLTNDGGLNELEQFQIYLSDYKIIVYDGLNPDRVIFSGNYLSNKKLYLLYNGGHYNVITNFKSAMAKRYICNACDTLYDFTQKSDRTLSLCTATPPGTKFRSKYCATCNRWFLSEN